MLCAWRVAAPLRCDSLAVRRAMQDYPFIRELRSPITEDQLRPLDPRCHVVQFNAPLTDGDFAKVARFLEADLSIPLRIYGHHGNSPDLAFLRYFPFLKGFQADVFEIQSWDGLRYLPDSLEFLALGATRRKLSLAPIARFSRLTDLFLEGHSNDIAVLSGFPHLTYLTLRSTTLRDLAMLRPLRNLRSLALKLGGTNRLALLRALSGIRYLELLMVRGLADVSVVADLPELRYLFLQDLKNVRSLPSFRSLRELRRCDIENLKGLSDITPIAEAPNLEELILVNMGHLSVESLACFRAHPTLKAASIGLGSKRRNEQAATLLGLGAVTEIKPVRKYVESRVDS